MKIRRLALADSSSDLFLNGRGFKPFVTGKYGSLSSPSTYSGVGLGRNSSNPSDSNDYLDGFDARFISTMAFLIVVLTALFFDYEESVGNSRRKPRGSCNAEATPRGLDRAAIESFSVFSYDLVKDLKVQAKEMVECAVCLGEFEDDDQLRLLPKCSDAFHLECIDTWLFSHGTCPVFRTTLVPTDGGNPTGTSYGIIEPTEITPPDEVAVVVDET